MLSQEPEMPTNLKIKAVITKQPINEGEIFTFDEERTDRIGASVTFSGYCRLDNDNLDALLLECYEQMAITQMQEICEAAAQKWPLTIIYASHRIGIIKPGERIVFVGVCASHRKHAFQGADFIMDFLKSRIPIWKKEILKNNEEGNWIIATEADETAILRW